MGVGCRFLTPILVLLVAAHADEGSASKPAPTTYNHTALFGCSLCVPSPTASSEPGGGLDGTFAYTNATSRAIWMAGGTIPRRVYQTYKSRKLVPAGVFETITKYAPDYEYVFMDDEHAILFLSERFQPSVLRRFKELRRGSHKVRPPTTRRGYYGQGPRA
jgi:hypothetical protein